MVIIFKSEKALNHLLNKGRVYTFRLKRRKVGRDWVTDRRGGCKICDVVVTPLATVTDVKELIPYVDGSGFDHIWDWVYEIKRLNLKAPKIRGYVYEVRRIG